MSVLRQIFRFPIENDHHILKTTLKAFFLLFLSLLDCRVFFFIKKIIFRQTNFEKNPKKANFCPFKEHFYF